MAAAALHVLLLFWSDGGPRGSDQFWYLADVETMVRGGPPISNTHFPAPLLRDPAGASVRYFTHNTLVLHAVKALAAVFGAHHGWLLLNWFATIATAALIYAMVNRMVGGWWAALAFAVYVLIPVSFWQCANTLQESAFGLISAVLTYGLVTTRKSLLRYLLFSALATFAILGNPVYLIVAIGFPLVALWECRARRAGVIAYAIVGFMAAAYVYANKATWLPESFQPQLRAIIVNSVPGVGNMEWFHRVEPLPITADLLWKKAIGALRAQFPASKQAVFFFPVNIAVLLALLLAYQTARDQAGRRLLLAAGVLFLLFCVVAVLHQNQVRYALIFLPAVLSAAVVGVARVFPSPRNRVISAICLLGLLGMVGVDAVLARHIRASGTVAARAIRDIQARLGDLAADTPVMIEGSTGKCLMIAYALRPRPCMLLLPGYLTDDQLRTVVERFAPRAFIYETESPLPTLLELPGPAQALTAELPELSVRRRPAPATQP